MTGHFSPRSRISSVGPRALSIAQYTASAMNGPRGFTLPKPAAKCVGLRDNISYRVTGTPITSTLLQERKLKSVLLDTNIMSKNIGSVRTKPFLGWVWVRNKAKPDGSITY